MPYANQPVEVFQQCNMNEHRLALDQPSGCEKRGPEEVVIKDGTAQIDEQEYLISIKSAPSQPTASPFISPILNFTEKWGLDDTSKFQRRKGFIGGAMIDLTRYSEGIDGIQLAQRKKTWEYAVDELEVVPARVFPKFKSLAQELQDIVWTLALTQPTIIECIYRSDMRQFYAHGSKKGILECSHLDPKHFDLKPIYLEPWQLLKTTLPDKKLAINPIYISTDDIVYLPEIYNFDIDAFIRCKSNGVIENLAIHASSALRLKVEGNGRFRSTESREGTLIRSLRNLTSLHVIEGDYVGAEMCSKHLGNYKLTLVEVKKGEVRDTINSSVAFQCKARHPWISGVADSIRMMLELSVLNNSLGLQNRGYLTWSKMELHFHELKRELIAMSHLG
jgi:hypothetical protein